MSVSLFVFKKNHRPFFPLEPLVAGVLAALGSAAPLPSQPTSSPLYPPNIVAKNDRGVDTATLELLRRRVAFVRSTCLCVLV